MRGAVLCVAALCCGWLVNGSGCRSPMRDSGSREVTSLQNTVANAIAREIHAEPQATTHPASQVLQELSGRRDELDNLSPLPPGGPRTFDLGQDLMGKDQKRVEVTLDQAITAAIEHNLAFREARLQPAISEAELRAAEAIFDFLLFGSAEMIKTDEPQFVPVITGIPLGTPFAASDNYRFETGVRKRFEPGTELSVSTNVTRFSNKSPGINFSPDPAYTAAVVLGLNQPLLRGFGSDVSTSTIRLARNELRRSESGLEIDLLQLVADAEQAYWNLLRAWRLLGIAEWLLDVGISVRDTLALRRELDVTAAQYSDAVARVEQRRADVIRAQRLVRAASDSLKRLMNDPELHVSSEMVLYPADDTFDSPIDYNLHEAILTALDKRPDIRQAALNIEDASIREMVARNDELPLLDARAQMAYFGLDDDIDGAYSEMAEGNFIDYVLGLNFEYPLGNQAAEANFRAARLRRSATALAYLRTVQDVIVEVKSALRDVVTNYELIEATRAFRVAQAENLRALLVQEETLVGLTPEFLNLKFQRQETLAEARREEIGAQVNFDNSLAELYRAMGIGLTMKRINVELIGPQSENGGGGVIDASYREPQ